MVVCVVKIAFVVCTERKEKKKRPIEEKLLDGKFVFGPNGNNGWGNGQNPTEVEAV